MSLKENGQTIWSAPRTIDELRVKYEEFFQELNLQDKTELPEYTAFSRHSRVVLLPQKSTDVWKVLNKIGQDIGNYRSPRVQKQFRRDRNIAREVAKSKSSKGHPSRLVFGLPHNYHFLEEKIDVKMKGRTVQEDYRRASPLFIHIHSVGREFATVLTFMPARFLPEGAEIYMSAEKALKGNRVQPLGDANVPCKINSYGDFHPITDFMDSFPHRMEVKVSG